MYLVHKIEIVISQNQISDITKSYLLLYASLQALKRVKHTEYSRNTEDPRNNDSVCYQRFCCKIEFAVIKKLDMDPSKA